MASDPPSRADFDALSPVAKEVAEAIACVASDIALVIDQDGVIRSVAEGTAALPAECSEWVGRRWVDTASSDSRRKIEMLLDELGANGVSQRREVNHPVVEGDAVPMAWTAIRLGEHGPVVAVGRDLRAVAAIQRRFLDAQHEMELDYWQRRHADSRFRTLFHVARDAVLVVDADGFGVVEANDAAQSLWPQGRDAPGGPRSLIERVADVARAPLAELLATARSSGRAGEVRLRMRAGGPTWDVSATPFTVLDRRQLLVRARAHDGEDGSDTPPAMMRALVESTPDAVVITDSAGHILVANPAFLALTRSGSEALLKGRTLAEAVGDVDGSWRDAIARTRLQGLCSRMPLNVTHGDLGVSVEVSSTLLTEGEQERLGFTLRTVEPPRTAGALAHQDGWPDLDALCAQVGLAPLATLLHEGSTAVERRIIRTALRLTSGQVAQAARLLHMEPRALSTRIEVLDRAGNGNGADDDAPDSSVPSRMN
jgi:transcriptional regulator PpsR